MTTRKLWKNDWLHITRKLRLSSTTTLYKGSITTLMPPSLPKKSLRTLTRSFWNPPKRRASLADFSRTLPTEIFSKMFFLLMGLVLERNRDNCKHVKITFQEHLHHGLHINLSNMNVTFTRITVKDTFRGNKTKICSSIL